MSQKTQNSTPSSGKGPIAGETAILARRYAEALYDLAAEQKSLDTVAEEMRALIKLNHDNTEFRIISAHPRLNRSEMVRAMQAVAKAAGLSPLSSNFLALLAQNRRLSILTAIADAFLSDLASRRGEFNAEVRTAKALSAQQQEQLVAKLRELAGGKVHLSIHEDKSLLGGLTVKLGSRLIDASIKTKLARLERQLKNQTTHPNTAQKGAA